MAMIDFSEEGDPTVGWMSSLTAPGQEEMQVELAGIKTKVRQSPYKDSKPVAEVKPGTVGTGTIVWDAGLCCAKMVERGGGKYAPFLKSEELKGKRVLELGCGVGGLPGLLCSVLGCGEVVLTDVDVVLPMLRENVDLFREAANSGGAAQCPVQVTELDWTDDGHIASVSLKPFDLVLGCDLLNSEGNMAPLVKVMDAVCGPGTTVLLVDSVRTPLSDREFRRVFGEEGYQLKDLDAEAFDPLFHHANMDATVVRRGANPKP